MEKTADKSVHRFGSGQFVFELTEDWMKVPQGWDLGEIPAVGVDSKDRVYLFTRSEYPVVVFDREGNCVDCWGKGIFSRAHGIYIGPDDSVYCADDHDHTVRKFTPEGRLLMTLGAKGIHSETGFVWGDNYSVQRSGPPFYRPTSVALSPDGAVYVADGYGNARVHKFSPEGELLLSWGEPGSGPGEFRIVHGICIDQEGTVYVGDRGNSRVQLFSPEGQFITEWTDVYQPNDLYLDGEGRMFVAEFGYNDPHHAQSPAASLNRPAPAPEDRYPRVTIRNLKGEVLASIANPDPRAPGGFLSTHGVRTDSRGDLYVSEVSAINARNRGLNPQEFHILQKFARVRI